MAAMWSYMQNVTKGNDAAANWGGSFDLQGMDAASQKEMVKNVMFVAFPCLFISNT